MTHRIQAEFAYSHRSERGVQSTGVTLQRGSGAYRDFAWLMIDTARSLGLPARFDARPTRTAWEAFNERRAYAVTTHTLLWRSAGSGAC